MSERTIIRMCNIGTAMMMLTLAVLSMATWERWLFGCLFGWYASATLRDW